MAGITMRILLRQQIQTGGTQPASQTAIVWSARKIETSRFRSGILVARLHAVTWTAGSSAQVVFEAGPDGYTDEDPGLNWAMPGAGNIVTFTEALDTAPSVRTGSIDTVLGHLPPLLVVRVKLVTGPAPGGASITPTLSADLCLREE